MGDFDGGNPSRIESDHMRASVPRINVRNPNNTPLVTNIRVEDAHELLAEHGITLMCWECTPPIENRFE